MRNAHIPHASNAPGSARKFCDADSLRNLPEAMRALPFCVWKMEQIGGRMTKVPYNPKSGFKAAVDNPRTFVDLETALSAFKSGSYNGVGINISGNVGSIDVDKCVSDDGTLSDTAAEILKLFPTAHVEYSPSGHGLHLYFLVPEEFDYDVEDYYINNGKRGLEIYLPGVTKHFLTVTGNVLHTGSMDVPLEALEQFRERFMKRPQLEAVTIEPPKGGSVLTNAEVLYKCANSQGGQTFVRYYNGDWEKPEDVNWSHSHADMSVCRRLAFFCRGDMNQMDELFRESGLMRDKWDRPLAGSTYGRVTMMNAIKGCTAFYEPQYHSSAAQDFDAFNPSDGGSEDGDAVDGSGTENDAENDEDSAEETQAERLDAWLARDLTVDDILRPEFLDLAGWAYKDDLPRYMLVKDKVPKNLGIRRFEREMKKHYLGKRDDEQNKMQMLTLTGCNTKSMIVPENWVVTDKGIWHYEMVFGELKPVPVSAEPAYVSAKVINVDDGTEKLELTYRRNGNYKTLVAPRSDILNKSSIIHYADFGFPVSSSNGANMTKYLSEMEAVNNHAIPVKRCINRAGWIGNEFYPYEMRDIVQYHDDDTGATNLVEELHTHGSEEKWLDMATQVRTYPFARFMLAVCFASPLLNKVSHRNIYTHIWFESRGGKTAVAKLGLGIWGDPEKLMGTYNATIFGLEQRCATLKHLPVVLDELQSLREKYMTVNDVVYTLGNGIGKTRGKIGSGIRKMDSWNNCILSTGEQPMSTDSSMDGVNTRLLEINACPLMNVEGEVDTELGIRLHTEARLNYGFAGKKFIHYLVHEVIGERTEEDETNPVLDADYQMILERLTQVASEAARSNPHFSSVAVIALGDFYSSIAVFGETRAQAIEEAVAMAALAIERIEADKPKNSIDAAWDFIVNWIASNNAHFVISDVPVGMYGPKEVSPIYGAIEEKKVYVIASEMNKALNDAGFSYRKCVKGFQRQGYIETFTDSEGKNRSQTAKAIKNVQTRVYVLNLKHTETRADDDMPPFAEPDEFLS